MPVRLDDSRGVRRSGGAHGQAPRQRVSHQRDTVRHQRAPHPEVTRGQRTRPKPARRADGPRSSRRRKPILVPVVAVFACLIVIAVCVVVSMKDYQMGRGASGVAAFDAIGNSNSVALLEQERQQLVDMNAATHVLSLVNKPMVVTPSQSGGSTGGGGVTWPTPNPELAKSIARQLMPDFGFSVSGQWACLDDIWTRESGWIYDAENTASGAYGIPQALPAWKMASVGADYLTNPSTQIRWGLGYIKGRYGTPCNAWGFELRNGYY